MLLTIDVGNTNIKFGVFRGDRLQSSWRISTDPRRMSDEYGLMLHNLLLLEKLDLKEIGGTCICSVVPPLTSTIEEMCRNYLKTVPLIVGAGTRTGVQIRYDTPRDVGADRIADAAAALRLYGGPVIVIDVGTATVFNAISKDGYYLGGAIAPGMRLAAESLYINTSQLRRVDLVAPSTAIGRNTVAAMQSGLVLGCVDLIEGLVRRFKKELGESAKVVGTGGLLNVIENETKVFDYVNKDLTLVGLRLIYEMNQGAAGGD
jgi:type III pantothenate kinase